MRYFQFLLILVYVCVSLPLTAAEKYEIDPVHSNVTFMVPHYLVGKIHGNFREFSGTIRLDADDVPNSTFRGKIKTASIDTGNADRDTDLKSERFFDVEKFPEITFESTKLEIKNYSYNMNGNLTIRGITKEVAIPFRIVGPIQDPKKELRIGVEAALTINRRDFGITFNEKLDNGGLIIGDEVIIHINGEAILREGDQEN